MKYSHIVNSVAALALLSLSLNASNVPGESARKCGNNAPEAVSGIKIGGYIGSRIDLCNSGMIMQENVDELVASVGYAHITPRRVLNKLYAVLHPDNAAAAEPATPTLRES